MKFRCSKCNYIFEGQPDFCPNCRSKMKYDIEKKDSQDKMYLQSVTTNNKPYIRHSYPRIIIEKDEDEEPGSYLGGFLLGFLLGLIGLIIALCIQKKRTERGALTGFLIQLVFVATGTIIYFIIAFGYLRFLFFR